MQKHLGYINSKDRKHLISYYERIASWRVYEENGEIFAQRVYRTYYDDYIEGIVWSEPKDEDEEPEKLFDLGNGIYGVSIEVRCDFNPEYVEHYLKYADDNDWVEIEGKKFEIFGKLEKNCKAWYNYDAEYRDREITDARPIEL